MSRRAKIAIPTFAGIALVLAVAFWPRHRIDGDYRWILGASDVTFVEMDGFYEADEESTDVGTYTGKKKLEGDGLPVFNGVFYAVDAPRKLSAADGAEFRNALMQFDRESNASLDFDCGQQPRTCLRFASEGKSVDVFICVYCHDVSFQTTDGQYLFGGDMHQSYPLFLRAVAKQIPDDDAVLKQLRELASS